MRPDPLPPAGDTIVAVSTPLGRSGLGVVRMSGPEARTFVERCFRSKEPFQDRLARYGRFENARGGLIDRVVLTMFQAPRSYTGEDVAEIGAHGNPMILNEICSVLVTLGARRAGPGEFTLRAVAHGKMDLAQAEAVRDFVEAQTERQAYAARLHMDGALARRVRPRKEALIQIVAELEAGIDFVEDEVGAPDSPDVAEQVADIAAAVEEDILSFDYGRLLADGLYVAIVGKPNVGKSSLFNRLLGQDRAIVTELRGTTRDVLSEAVEIEGVPIRFADTAGLRETAADVVEAIGVGRTLETLAEADLTLAVFDSSRPLDGEDADVLERVEQRPHILVVNKSDLPSRWDPLQAKMPGRIPGKPLIRVSARTGAGIDRLTGRIRDFVARQRPDADGFLLTSRRQQETLLDSAEKLRAAARALERSVPHEMVLLDLYAALSRFGELTGEVVTEDILDKVFSTFCIGK